MTEDSPGNVEAREARIEALVQQLDEVQQQLQDLVGGNLLSASPENLLLHRAILNTLPAHIAVLDRNGVVVAVNEPWRRFAVENGATQIATDVGGNYLRVCDEATGRNSEGAAEVAAGLRRVLSGETSEYAFDYPCHAPAEQRWFRVVAAAFGAQPNTGVVVMHLDTTASRLAEEGLSALAIAQHAIASATGTVSDLMPLVTHHVLALTRASGAVVAVAEGDSVVYRCVAGSVAGRMGTAAGRASSMSGRSSRLARRYMQRTSNWTRPWTGSCAGASVSDPSSSSRSGPADGCGGC